ncbi:hypothetical protein [Pseudonocardia sp.]|uniref:hypothetical protein n=1 Tax=Pseudonocardia sp. TaxID=60912 RepID=UPI0031FC0A31
MAKLGVDADDTAVIVDRGPVDNDGEGDTAVVVDRRPVDNDGKGWCAVRSRAGGP